MSTIVNKAKGLISDAKTYWKTPMPKRYMSFKEIFAYSGGGIGAYFIMNLGTACILSASSTLVTSTLGVTPVDCYIMYVIVVLINIPLTGIRANIIDNTRNKAGKYRPYIVTMAIPTALICMTMVWFPYSVFENIFGSEATVFGKPTFYVAKCALILFLNILLHFFYYFFYDSYENLIHVLSPNSQERADVSAIKSVVYSFAPSIVNLITPIIASNVFHSNSTDIRVYRLLYPILSVLGILLCIAIYVNTEEKIVQAKTHIIQIKFTDALRAVAHNKYFWIISLATWVGFLETAYTNILYWLYNYGGVCSGTTFGLVITIKGNASLWGMLLAPFMVRKFGKKAVLIVTNLFNVLFILCMLPSTIELNNATIWYVLICLYLNQFVSSFMLILNPAIQADIRDYQQYITGERIDGMFSAVATIGTVITLASSVVLPIVYQMEGLTETVAAKVTSNPEILNRMLGDGKTVGQILNEQLASGQNNFINANSALYDPDILIKLLHVLIIFSACGALFNVIPYIWYDFNEKKQKSVVNVLKIRAMFEDYSNGSINDATLVEAVDIIRQAREDREKAPVENIKAIKNKAERNKAKQLNEDIEIANFVCDELCKFSKPEFIYQLELCNDIYSKGIGRIESMTGQEVSADLKAAKAMPRSTAEEKAIRKIAIESARSSKSAYTAYNKYFKGKQELEVPDFTILESYFEKEDECDEKISALAKKREKGSREKIKALQAERKRIRECSKKEMDKHAWFNRAAKPYLDAEKVLDQCENYKHLEEIEAMYDVSKARYEAKLANDAAEAERLKEEEAALKKAASEKRLEEKKAKKR